MLVGGGQSLEPSNNKRFGFTLAEVLITLGIIGVVAALTLPTLIQKYRKQVWVNQLKKSVSTFDNGFKMMLADAGTDDLLNTELWESLEEEGYCCGMSNPMHSDEILKKYFKILDIADSEGDYRTCSFEADENNDDENNEKLVYKLLNGNEYSFEFLIRGRKIQMADGSTIGVYLYPFENYVYTHSAGVIAIDVNGKNKGPNQWGRDTFAFNIDEKGFLIPKMTYEDIKSYSEYCGNIETGDISNAIGVGCEARIIHDGWKMNY